MAFLTEEKKQALIQLAAEHGVQATAIRLYGQFVFFLRRGGELIFDDAMDLAEVRRYLEGLRQ